MMILWEEHSCGSPPIKNLILDFTNCFVNSVLPLPASASLSLSLRFAVEDRGSKLCVNCHMSPDLGRGQKAKIRAWTLKGILHFAFCILPKYLRASLVSLLGWSKSKLTYLTPLHWTQRKKRQFFAMYCLWKIKNNHKNGPTISIFYCNFWKFFLKFWHKW